MSESTTSLPGMSKQESGPDNPVRTDRLLKSDDILVPAVDRMLQEYHLWAPSGEE